MEARAGAALGALYTAVVSCWWLAGTSIAIGRGASASGIAASALAALWLGRALILCVMALRLGASASSPRPLALLIVVCWPVLVLMALASGARMVDLVWGEVLLAVGAAVLALAGVLLARVPVVRLAPTGYATLIGILGALALWQHRSQFLTWLAL
jgi:hypothetical protein